MGWAGVFLKKQFLKIEAESWAYKQEGPVGKEVLQQPHLSFNRKNSNVSDEDAMFFAVILLTINLLSENLHKKVIGN